MFAPKFRSQRSPRRSASAGIGPQIGYLFPAGEMQGYLNLKGYYEYDAKNRPRGWNLWLTFAISPAASQPSRPSRMRAYPHRKN
jgi:hypothetical protein